MLIYILLLLGIILIFWGYILQRKHKQQQRESFQEIIEQEQKENSPYIESRAAYQEMIQKFAHIEEKMEQILDHIENMKKQDLLQIPEQAEEKEEKEQRAETEEDIPKIQEIKSMKEKAAPKKTQKESSYIFPIAYQETIEKIKALEKQNRTIEEIATSLGMGKGEVLFLKNLLRK